MTTRKASSERPASSRWFNVMMFLWALGMTLIGLSVLVNTWPHL